MRITAFIICLTLLYSTSNAEYLSASNGLVVSRSDLASEVGSEILQQGGNAIDAAVAVGFALAVTYPSAGNLGGGGFMVLHLAEGDVLTLDFREKAPLGASRDMFLDEDGNVDRRLSISSLLASGVPGTVAGLLDALEKHGTMSRQQVLAPAIRLARDGFNLNQDLSSQFENSLERFSQYPSSTKVFSNNGISYKSGDNWQQPDLASTLDRISEQGRDGFYKGTTAELIVSAMEKDGGMISHADLMQYQPLWREPIHGTYRGYDIWSMPPPSSGGILLIQMLNMLEPFNLGDLGKGSTQSVHLMIEAQRRAYADRAEHLGDPDFFEVPVSRLIEKTYARQRFDDFSMDQASNSSEIAAGQWPYESPQTTHYSVVDDQGNAVAVTTTLNRSYGNHYVVPGAGFLLNNEMDDFSSKPNTPNSYGLIGRVANEIQPEKRMLSSMTPTIVARNGEVVIVTGSPGGSTIINTVLQVITNIIDFKMDVNQAVSSPRIHHQWQPDIVRYEIGAISDETRSSLQAIGHRGLTGSRFPIGDANTILVTEQGFEGMSDPRNEGGAAGF